MWNSSSICSSLNAERAQGNLLRLAVVCHACPSSTSPSPASRLQPAHRMPADAGREANAQARCPLQQRRCSGGLHPRTAIRELPSSLSTSSNTHSPTHLFQAAQYRRAAAKRLDRRGIDAARAERPFVRPPRARRPVRRPAWARAAVRRPAVPCAVRALALGLATGYGTTYRTFSVSH